MYNTTTNGALQHETSGNKCLDLFSVIGNLRECSRTDILERFEQAFKENSDNKENKNFSNLTDVIVGTMLDEVIEIFENDNIRFCEDTFRDAISK